MFTQKRKRFFQQPAFYAAVALCVVSAGVAVNLIGDTEKSGILTVDTPVGTVREELPENADSESAAASDAGIFAEISDTGQGAYYLIKERDGSVNVYAYDEEGIESFFMVTDIVFSLISSDDQNMFSEGVMVKSLEELYSVLEDFES